MFVICQMFSQSAQLWTIVTPSPTQGNCVVLLNKALLSQCLSPNHTIPSQGTVLCYWTRHFTVLVCQSLSLQPWSGHSHPQRPRSLWSAPSIATSGPVQQRKSAIHGLPVTLRMLWVKSDKSDWFWFQSIVFTNPFKTGMLLDKARGRHSWCWPKGARPLGTRMWSG